MNVDLLSIVKTNKFIKVSDKSISVDEYLVARKSIMKLGLKVDVSPSENNFDNAIRSCFVIGSFKVGKTTLCENIVKSFGYNSVLVKSDSVINTKGEIIMHLPKINTLLIDTEGLNQILLNRHSFFIKQFILSHAIKFSKILIMVIDKFTKEEHDQLLQIIVSLKSNNDKVRFIVLHNLKYLHSEEKLNEYVKEYLALHKDLFNSDENESLVSTGVDNMRISSKIGDFTFEEIFCGDAKLNSYNKMIEKIKNIINSEESSLIINLNKTIEQSLNMLTDDDSKIEFNGSRLINLDFIKFEISHQFLVHFVKAFSDKDYEYHQHEVSIPMMAQDLNKILILLSDQIITVIVQVTTQIKGEFFSKTQRFKIIDNRILVSQECQDFCNKSIELTNHCSFTFKTKTRGIKKNI